MHLVDCITNIVELLDSPISNLITLAENYCVYEGTTADIIVNYLHPFFLKYKAASSQAYNPNWRQAMDGQFADEYLEAAVTEIGTIESMSAWKVVDCEDDMNVIWSTWAFKLKRYPYVLIKKFKAHLCARSDMQLEGIDFF